MERVLILGATSAIAAAVARLHAARGDRLHLVGRSSEKLAALVAELRGAHGSLELTYASADLANLEENERLIAASIASLDGLDRALIAHGLLDDQLASERSFAKAGVSLQVNFLSPVSLLIPLANHFESVRSGCIAAITSVAGDRGRPRNYTYGSAKGALNLYLQGLRSRLYSSGVRVVTIKLGPVDTPMTASHEKSALFGKPDAVARSIVRAVDRASGEVYVPSFWRAIMLIVRSTPEWIFQRLRSLSSR